MKEKAIIIDLDGTLCENSKRVHFVTTSPKDYEQFYKYIPEDKPNFWAGEMMRAMKFRGYKPLFVTGRPERTKELDVQKLTNDWLMKYFKFSGPLFMRKPGDYRSDYEVKKEIISELKKEFNILFAVDDRPGPWKAIQELGIPCLYCGPYCEPEHE